jgi:Uma2 family endonuclease
MNILLEHPEMVGLESAGVLMTPGEFDAIEDWDENYRYELIHGVLVVSAIPLPQERGPNELLGHWLWKYKEDHPSGSALDYTIFHEYVRGEDTRRIADRLIWAGLGRMPNRRRDPATIAVEFVSAGRRNFQRDYVAKRAEYMKVGIKEYWIIDRFQRTLTVIHNRPEGPPEEVIKEGQNYQTPLLPGFVLPLSELLQAADRLAQME